MQRTVQQDITWKGIGLHTGLETSVTITPADEKFGIKFSNHKDSDQWIKADVRFVSSTHRSTNLKSGDIEISTVEHLLAALSAAGVTNAKVIVDGPEIPILDGSAFMFYDKIITHVVDQGDLTVAPYVVDELIHFKDDVSGAEYTVIPDESFVLEVVIDFDQKQIGQKYASFNKASDDFKTTIAPARTFVFTHEVVELCDAGLIKGGSIDNAIILKSDNASEEQFKAALIALSQPNPEEIIAKVNKGISLQSENEPAQHKLLDLYGDLALLGAPMKGRIIAKRPGHTGNIALVKKLKEHYQSQIKLANVPKYDPNKEPVYDINTVSQMLPHRYPFLLVDKIIELTDTYVVGVKNITMNENYFTGHFPGNPVFPGVLQMEALAQTGGILALSTVGNPSDFDTYFLKLDVVKFKRKVLPGDTLLLKMELIAPIRRGIVQMRGTTFVGNQVASEGELTAQIVDRTKVK